MAVLKKNKLVEGFSGAFGDEFVFRRYNSKTFISQLPTPSKRLATPALKKTRDDFLKAVKYANQIRSNPLLKSEYEHIKKHKGQHSAFVVAISDHMKSANVMKVNARRSDKEGHYRIQILMEDNYFVLEMLLSLSHPDGTILEQGKASFVFGDKTWCYKTNAGYEVLTGIIVVMQVKDRPGRSFTFERVLG